MRRFTVWLIGVCLLLMMCVNIAFAQGAFPNMDETGFLPEGEYVYKDAEKGLWQYMSASLKIEITRHEDKAKKITWLEAEIWAKEGETFHMIPKDPERRFKAVDHIVNIAAENGVVFALSSDFAHLRIQQKIVAGILVRENEIISTKTRSAKSTKFPNLDTLALFPDGNMQVFEFNEHTAEEYVDMGAFDVLAFGPYLVRDGVLNEGDIKNYGKYREPRAAIGMYEAGHYLAVLVEGRRDETKGISIATLAELFFEKGCTLAFNLDGGQSVGMAFMGEQISHTGKTQSLTAKPRQTAEILGIGYSQSLVKTE